VLGPVGGLGKANEIFGYLGSLLPFPLMIQKIRFYIFPTAFHIIYFNNSDFFAYIITGLQYDASIKVMWDGELLIAITYPVLKYIVAEILFGLMMISESIKTVKNGTLTTSHEINM